MMNMNGVNNATKRDNRHSTQNDYNQRNMQEKNPTSIFEQLTNDVKKIGGAFVNGAVSVAKDVAKEEGKKFAEQAISMLTNK